MAARNKLSHDYKTRQKIQVSQLVNRLSNHSLGKCEMTSTQVQAARILLDKSLPSLMSQSVGIDPENNRLEIVHKSV